MGKMTYRQRVRERIAPDLYEMFVEYYEACPWEHERPAFIGGPDSYWKWLDEQIDRMEMMAVERPGLLEKVADTDERCIPQYAWEPDATKTRAMVRLRRSILDQHGIEPGSGGQARML